MRKVRTGSRIIRRPLRARFTARDSPPTRGVLRQFTHFSASGRGLSLRAAAVATSDRRLRHPTGSIGPHRERCNGDHDAKLEKQPATKPHQAFRKRRSHDRVSFRLSLKKTDRPARQISDVTRVLVRGCEMSRPLLKGLSSSDQPTSNCKHIL
jgi:hypothetical protein